MRALLFVHCFYPDHIYGTEAYTLAVAKELKARGWDVRVVTTTLQGEPAQPSFVNEYVWEGVPVLSYDKNAVPHVDVRGTYYQPEMRTYHERLIRYWQPDAVHINHPMSHTVALHEVCRSLDVPVFGTLTDFFGICLNNKLQASDGSLCAGPNTSRSNCVACQITAMASDPRTKAHQLKDRPFRTRATAAAMTRGFLDPSRDYGFNLSDIQQRPTIIAERYKVFRELIAPSTFLLDAYSRNNIPARMRLSHFGVEIDRRDKPARAEGTPLKVGYIGQVAPHKGTHLLLEAVRTLNVGDALEVDIWGPANQDPAYMGQLRELSQGVNVRFCGTFPSAQTADVLAELDLLVIPSTWYENSPLILLQALATHTPCIVSDVLGMTEFVVDNVSGFAFKRGSAPHLASILRRFLTDTSLARRLSASTFYARTTVEMVDDIVAMYEDNGVAETRPSATRPVDALADF